jgi:hypothetical protein
MPLLAVWFSSVWSAIAGYVVWFWTKRVGLYSAYLTLVVATFSTLAIAVKLALTGIATSFPSLGSGGIFSHTVALTSCLLPPNTFGCLAAVGSTFIATWAARHWLGAIKQLTASVT